MIQKSWGMHMFIKHVMLFNSLSDFHGFCMHLGHVSKLFSAVLGAEILLHFQ